jgi:hypothetical protein
LSCRWGDRLIFSGFSLAEHGIEIAESGTGADVLLHHIQSGLILAQNVGATTVSLALLAMVILVKLITT